MRVSVWAPRAATVDVVPPEGAAAAPGSGVARLAADPVRPGWHAGEVGWLAAGVQYLLSLDGDDPGPDPLARRLPAGVHGPAQSWDPAAHPWSDRGWPGRDLADGGVVYELHVGTFTHGGTLDTAAARVGYLRDLGVSHIQLMPLAAFDGPHGWGYDGVALNAVHEPYGGPDALCRFVDAAHAHGLAVLLDVVYNHFGPSGNVWERFGPFVTDEHSTPWGGAINLDTPGSDDVREILLASARGWLRDFHLDGLRLDAVHELHDSRAVSYLEELSEAVDALAVEVGRPLAVVAETDRNDPAMVTPRAGGGTGITAQWDDDVHHALHVLLTGETKGYYADFGSAGAVAHALEHAFLHDRRWSTFRGRTHGRPVDWSRTDPWRFVVSLQTHDQVGNRALGERLAALAGPDVAACGAAVLLTLPYTPMLFMGEEWGATTPWQFFTSFGDRRVAAAVTAGRREEFAGHGWTADQVPDPQDPATFERSQLDAPPAWTQDTSDARLLRWYRDLLALRRHEPDLAGACAGSVPDAGPVATAGGIRCSWSAPADGPPEWFVVARGRWRTVVNLTGVEQGVPLGGGHWDRATVRLAWRDGATVPVEQPTSVRLEPRTAAVLELGVDGTGPQGSQ